MCNGHKKIVLDDSFSLLSPDYLMFWVCGFSPWRSIFLKKVVIIRVMYMNLFGKVSV